MTKAAFLDDGKFLEVRMTGHSGKPEVCAGCSALGCTLAAMAEKEPGGKAIMGEGSLRVTMRSNRKTRQWAKVILTGLKMIAREYPENLKIEDAKKWSDGLEIRKAGLIG